MDYSFCLAHLHQGKALDLVDVPKLAPALNSILGSRNKVGRFAIE